MQLDNYHKPPTPTNPAHSQFLPIFCPINSYNNYSPLHWTDYSIQTVHLWLWAGCLAIKFWLNRDKAQNTCLQNSGCHAKLSRRCSDLYLGIVEPCHNIPNLIYHSVIWGTGSLTLALDRGDRWTPHLLLCPQDQQPHSHTSKSNSWSSSQ